MDEINSNFVLLGLFSFFLILSNYFSFQFGKTKVITNTKEKKRDELVQNLFALEKFKEELISQNDLGKIASAIIGYLNRQIESEKVTVYSWDENQGHFRAFLEAEGENEENIPLPVYHPFLLWLSEQEGIHLKSFFEQDRTANHTKIKKDALQFFEITNSEMVATLTMKSSLVGFLLLGKKKDGSQYGFKEIEIILEIISVSLMAFSNSMIYTQLVHLTETLEAKVKERTKELEDAQAQLVQSEKMASLGVMVAGIAHEINTPAGVINGSADNLEANMMYTYTHFSDLESMQSDPEIKKDFMYLMLELLNEENRSKIDPKDKFRLKKEVKSRLAQNGLDEKDSQELSQFLIDHSILYLEDKLLQIWKSSGRSVYEILKNANGVYRNIRNIKYAIKNIVRIVKALKYYSHIGQSSYALADLHESIENTLVILQNQIKQGIQISREYGNIPKVFCNVDELNQVWTNLIINAIHALRTEGSPTISISTNLEDEKTVRVAFQDNGTGIPKDIITRIWDPFFTTKDQGEGTGLGLGIVKGIIERHKGKIEANSEPGRTVFSVLLPIEGPGEVPMIPKALIREVRG